MHWAGKVGGGLLGLLAGGPIGLIIGALLGHQFDRGFQAARPARRSRRRSRPRFDAGGETLFFESLFLTMGHLAKADGRVSEQEIAAARQTMRQLRLGPDRMREAILLFNRGKQPDFPLADRIALLRRACAGQPQLSQAFLQLQLDFLLAKGHIAPREREVLNGVAEGLGFGRLDLARLEAASRARSRFGQRPGRRMPDRDQELAGAFRTLGVDPSASAQEIKQAYRRLMSRHHPDKQVARGGSEHDLAHSAQRTREILAAYELIRERRGIR